MPCVALLEACRCRAQSYWTWSPHLLAVVMLTRKARAVTYGFVGVGTMSSAMVRGICTLPTPPCQAVVLSPRGSAKSAALASEFPALCTIAASNQEVVDKCDVIFIGVLPKQAEEVCRELKFKDNQIVVSLVSTAPMSMLHEACAPVPTGSIVRAIPLPPVAKHRGATVMTPPHPAITSLFASLGTVVPVESETIMMGTTMI